MIGDHSNESNITTILMRSRLHDADECQQRFAPAVAARYRQRSTRSHLCGVDDEADARILASLFSPKIAVWLPILHRLGVSLLDVMRLDAAAEANGTDFQSELLASNLVGEHELFREIAREFQIDFIEQIDPHKLTISDDQCSELLRSRGKYLRASMFGRDGRARSIFVPRGLPLTDLRRVMERNKDFRRIICMTSPRELRRAVHARIQKRLAVEARNGLFERYPIYSARHV